jgi:hypothetical protein
VAGLLEVTTKPLAGLLVRGESLTGSFGVAG